MNRFIVLLVLLLGAHYNVTKGQEGAGSPPVTLSAMYSANLNALKSAREEIRQLHEKCDALKEELATSKSGESSANCECSILREALLSLLQEGGPLTGGLAVLEDSKLTINDIFSLVKKAAEDLRALNLELWREANIKKPVARRSLSKRDALLLEVLKIE